MSEHWKLDNQRIYPTPPLQEYLAALEFAGRPNNADQRLILVIGESGAGKTVGARIFARECDRDRRPIYIAMPAAETLSTRDLLGLLGRPVGLTFDLHCPRYEAAQQLARDSVDRPRIYLLDDAHAMMKRGLLDIIRWLHDTGGHCFVLVGPPALERAFLKQSELAGRVAVCHHLRLPTAVEIAPLFRGFPQEAVEQIHLETGGRMRQVIALKQRIENLATQRKLDTSELLPQQVKLVAQHFTVKVA